MSRFARVSILLAALPIAVAASQSRPNFNGRWVAVEPAKVAGHELVIIQDGSTLKLEQVRIRSQETYDSLGRRVDPGGQRESTTYRLDGETTLGGRAPSTVRSSLIQEAHGFVLRDFYPAVGMRFERRLSFAAGERLVVEQLQPRISQDPDRASETVLDIRRIVYERR
jgi:hypothetical protein